MLGRLMGSFRMLGHNNRAGVCCYSRGGSPICRNDNRYLTYQFCSYIYIVDSGSTHTLIAKAFVDRMGVSVEDLDL